MQEVRYAHLLPQEFIARQMEFPVLYFPLGPLEWHGRHLAPGTDPVHAEAVAMALAKQLGGIVYPTLYMGGERYLPTEFLETLSINTQEHPNVLGMDFGKGEILPSIYFSEDLFGLVLREHLRKLMEHSFKVILLLSGHAAGPHMETISRVADEFNRLNPEVRVLSQMAIIPGPKCNGIGHANEQEVSLMLNIAPDMVDLSVLPPKPERIRSADTTAIDPETFAGQNPENYLIHDPRDATVEYGQQLLDGEIATFKQLVLKTLASI